MHNNVKSEQGFAVTNTSRGLVLPGNLKSLREEAGSQLYNDNESSISQGSKLLCEGGCCK